MTGMSDDRPLTPEECDEFGYNAGTTLSDLYLDRSHFYRLRTSVPGVGHSDDEILWAAAAIQRERVTTMPDEYGTEAEMYLMHVGALRAETRIRRIVDKRRRKGS